MYSSKLRLESKDARLFVQIPGDPWQRPPSGFCCEMTTFHCRVMVPTDRWPLGSPGPASQASQIPDDAADRWLSREGKKYSESHSCHCQYKQHAVRAGASNVRASLLLGIHPGHSCYSDIVFCRF